MRLEKSSAAVSVMLLGLGILPTFWRAAVRTGETVSEPVAISRKKPMTARLSSEGEDQSHPIESPWPWEAQLTGGLEDKVNLSWKELPVQVVLARGVEVELPQFVRNGANGSRALGVDLDGSAQVLKLSTIRVRVDGQAKARAANIGLLSVEVDRRLVGPDGAELAERIQTVPVQGTVEPMVAERAPGALRKATRARAQSGTVVADSSR